MSLVHTFLEQSCAKKPDQPLLVDGEKIFTYADVDQEATVVAKNLVGCGVAPGDRVALLSTNSLFYVASYYGILKAGAVAVPVNTAVEARGLGALLKDCGASILVLDKSHQRLVVKGWRDLGALATVLTPAPQRFAKACQDAEFEVLDAAASSPSGVLPAAIMPDQLASIVYTSGSTGRPRGAMLTHGNLVANTHSILDYLRLSPEDRVMAILPFYYVYGKSVLNTHVAAGATVVIENRFLYPQIALDTLEQQRCTGLSGVPSTFNILLSRTNFAERPLEDLRYVTQAGGPMSPSLTRQLIEAIPDKKIFIMYGATEASARLAYLPPEDLSEAVGSIGKAIPGVDLRLLRKDGSEAAVGKEGEIVAKGANIMQGYWGDPEETQRVLDADGYHTGDLAIRDARGYITIVGRIRDMIKSGGHRIAGQEIEHAMARHPEVDEVAVIGIPDELLGESIAAFLVARPDATEPAELAKKLRGFLGDCLPKYKIPHQIEIRNSLPKNESGKILKSVLRQECAGV